MSEKITVPMSKADLLDRLARIMRDRAYPEFGMSAPPLWAADAAETILALFEDLTKLALVPSPETTPAGVLDERCAALEEFLAASDAVEAGVLDFTLHASAVERLRAARKALG